MGVTWHFHPLAYELPAKQKVNVFSKTFSFHAYIYEKNPTENIYAYIYTRVSIQDIIRAAIRIIRALFVNSALHPTVGNNPEVEAGCGAGVLPVGLSLAR